jgi:hypothetical protein
MPFSGMTAPALWKGGGSKIGRPRAHRCVGSISIAFRRQGMSQVWMHRGRGARMDERGPELRKAPSITASHVEDASRPFIPLLPEMAIQNTYCTVRCCAARRSGVTSGSHRHRVICTVTSYTFIRRLVQPCPHPYLTKPIKRVLC